MAQETFTSAQFYAECEKLGEDKVREGVLTKRYGSGNHKLELAQEWLRRKEQERESAQVAEQTAIAQRAADAAWVSAEQSKSANLTSKISLVVAAISLIATVLLALYRP